MKSILSFLVIASLMLVSCKRFKNQIEFEVLTERESSGSIVNVNASSNKAFSEGIRIPSDEDPLSSFKFNFRFTNQLEQASKFYYKIFYQNESYKYSEFTDDSSEYNIKSAENFYGSWLNTKIGFKELGYLEVGQEISRTDSLVIAGNPRNERKYFGYPRDQNITDKMINEKIREIRDNPEWLKSIVDKAPANNLSSEEQIFIDAIWSLNDLQSSSKLFEQQEEMVNATLKEMRDNEEWFASIVKKAKANNKSYDEQALEDAQWLYTQKYPHLKIFKNNRFKRNPRMGEYSFMLVVIAEEDYNKLPHYARSIENKDESIGEFVNPYYYFQSDEFLSSIPYNPVVFGDKRLKTSISLDPSKGVYVNPVEFRDPTISNEYYREDIGNSLDLYLNADFEEYFHRINYDYTLYNIPERANVTEGYTRAQFEENIKKYPLENRPASHPTNTLFPGRTIGYDSTQQAIYIMNPGNRDADVFQKQNVGIKSRIGITYGKFTGKIKFPDMLSQDHVWNGVTCAYWLFSEDMLPWNERDICEGSGYLPKGAKKGSDERLERSEYSEIDIEIVKTSKYWAQSSYGGVDDYPVDDPENNRNLIVATTNWDLACKEPENFHAGVQDIGYEDQTFTYHRWDSWYQAITSKYEYPHDKTVGDVLYYQIDWQPDKIIWRIGPDKDNMQVVGYTDGSLTKIPNNQMITIVTQEFHYGDWWPLTPFKQKDIPYPLDDIKGYIYDLTVE